MLLLMFILHELILLLSLLELSNRGERNMLHVGGDKSIIPNDCTTFSLKCVYRYQDRFFFELM